MANADKQIQDLLSRRDFPKAEILIRELLREEPDSADGHYFLGVWHYLQGHLGESVQYLRRSLEIDPHHTDASICLSVLFNDVGKYEEAKRVFEQANQSVAHHKGSTEQEINKKFAVKHLELADLYFRYRRFDEAIEGYAKAATLDPTQLDTRIRLAKAYAKKGFLSRALQELQDLKAQHPKFIPARIQLGLLHYSQGNLLDAELEWESVSEIEPMNREALAYLEMAKQMRNQQSREIPRGMS